MKATVHHTALGVVVTFGDAGRNTKREIAMKKTKTKTKSSAPRNAEADDRPYACTVCLAPVGPGGRKSAPAKCARCYVRERRGQPEAARSTAEPRDQSVTFQISKSGRELLERRAAKMKITLSTLISRIVLGEIRVDVVPAR